jgi:hypothetical protein
LSKHAVIKRKNRSKNYRLSHFFRLFLLCIVDIGLLLQEWEPFSNLWAAALINFLLQHAFLWSFSKTQNAMLFGKVTAYHWIEDSEKWMCGAQTSEF